MKHPLHSRALAAGLAFFVAAWAVAPGLGYLCEVAVAVAEARSFLGKREGPVAKLALDSTDAARLRWVGEREFWHEGRLFDLLEIERRGDSLLFTARCDEREAAAHLFFEKKTSAGGEPGRGPRGGSFWQSWLDCPLDLPTAAPGIAPRPFFSKRDRPVERPVPVGLGFPPPFPPPRGVSQTSFL